MPFVANLFILYQIELATDEDKAYQIDYWARLFKAKTWEDKSPEVIKKSWHIPPPALWQFFQALPFPSPALSAFAFVRKA